MDTPKPTAEAPNRALEEVPGTFKSSYWEGSHFLSGAMMQGGGDPERRWLLRSALTRFQLQRERQALVKTFFWGVITGAVLLVAAVCLYFVTGIAPAATSASPMPMEDFLASAALHARIRRESPKSVPITVDEGIYLEGARVYREDCAVCHGLPGIPQSAISKGLFPEAPQLFKGKGVTDDEPGETYWKVVNGIRLTGMPGFRQSLSERQAWEVSLLLANADKLPDPVRAVLGQPVEQSKLR